MVAPFINKNINEEQKKKVFPAKRVGFLFESILCDDVMTKKKKKEVVANQSVGFRSQKKTNEQIVSPCPPSDATGRSTLFFLKPVTLKWRLVVLEHHCQF